MFGAAPLSSSDMKSVRSALRQVSLTELLGPNTVAANKSKWPDFLENVLSNYQKRERIKINKEDARSLIQSILDDLLGFGPIESFMKDDSVSEILINGPSLIYVERAGLLEETSAEFDDVSHLMFHVKRLLRDSGKRVDDSKPFVDLAFSDGTRVHVALPPCAVHGPNVSIRKGKRQVSTLEDLYAAKTMTPEMAAFLKKCIQNKTNILFSGATSTGKTTLLEIFSQFIDDHERVVVLEDTPELHLRQKHTVNLLTRDVNLEGKGEITLSTLFKNSLRMRPDRVILGEIRGSEAFYYLQALTSGHRGSMAVIHAKSPEEVILRFEGLAAVESNLPPSILRRQILSGLEVIVQLARLDDGSRRVMQISYVSASPEGEVVVKDIFRFEQKGSSISSDGEFVSFEKTL